MELVKRRVNKIDDEYQGTIGLEKARRPTFATARKQILTPSLQFDKL